MAVVIPPVAAAAASFTAVPRSLASAISPVFAGTPLTTSFSGLPLVMCGVLKMVYDVALLVSFRGVKPTGGAGQIGFSSIGSNAHGIVNFFTDAGIGLWTKADSV
jgi:hypothetical protein